MIEIDWNREKFLFDWKRILPHLTVRDSMSCTMLVRSVGQI